MEKKIYAFQTKYVQQMIDEANEAHRNFDGREMSEEEEIEDDAEGGYFQEDADD